jgi:bacillithiol biosynthesis deacetylase BshB1
MSVDILAFGPHPDDAEIGTGGLLRKMKDRGRTTGIIDMTAGDMGWGTPELRAEEGRKAAEFLRLDVRECLDMGDCRVEDTFENRCKVASVIRRHRPQIILAPYYDLPIGRGLGHNDHYKGGEIVSNAFNLAHLAKAPCEGEPYQAKAIYYYFVPPGTKATFVVDITPYAEDWLSAIDCHLTQFYHPDRKRPEHLPHPREAFESYARYWGWQIGVKYAQAFISTTPLKVDDPFMLVETTTTRP